MERIFNCFREASEEAARVCRENGVGASIERREDRWVVVFDQSLLHEASQPLAAVSLALENNQLLAELGRVQHELTSMRGLNDQLTSRISVLEKEQALVKPLLERGVSSPFAQSVLDKMQRENAETIHRYEYLCVLHESGEISEGAFRNFKAASGLWIALHNYEKVKAGPQPIHVPDRPRPSLMHCSSCGGVVINGHCKCSD